MLLDCLEECFWPYLTYVLAWAIAWVVPCVGCAICAGLVAISTGLQEVQYLANKK